MKVTVVIKVTGLDLKKGVIVTFYLCLVATSVMIAPLVCSLIRMRGPWLFVKTVR